MKIIPKLVCGAVLLACLMVVPIGTSAVGACSEAKTSVFSVDELVDLLDSDSATAWESEVVHTVEPFSLPIFEKWTRVSAAVPMRVWGTDVDPDPIVGRTHNNALAIRQDCNGPVPLPGNGPALGTTEFYVTDASGDLRVSLPLPRGSGSTTVDSEQQLVELLSDALGPARVVDRNVADDRALLDGTTTARWLTVRALLGRVVVPALVVWLLLRTRRRLVSLP